MKTRKYRFRPNGKVYEIGLGNSSGSVIHTTLDKPITCGPRDIVEITTEIDLNSKETIKVVKLKFIARELYHLKMWWKYDIKYRLKQWYYRQTN